MRQKENKMHQVKYRLKDFFHGSLKSPLYQGSYKERILNSSLKKLKHKCKKTIKSNIEKMGGPGGDRDWSPEDLKTIYTLHKDYWNKHQTYQNMPHRQLRGLRYILFANPNEGVLSGIYNNSHQFNDLKNTLVKKNRQAFLKHLISDLLYEYPKDKSLLFKRLKDISHSLLRQKISNHNLMEANKQFNILEEKGPECVARAVLNTDTTLEDTLQNLWLKERHLSGGIGQVIIKKMCELSNRVFGRLSKTSPSREDKTKLTRFLKYVSGPPQKNEESKKHDLPVDFRENEENKTSEENLPEGRYQDVKPIVKSLLNPFKNTLPPEDSIKQSITNFLDRHVGDPRFKSEQWIGMRGEEDIFMQWKTAESIQAFIALLGYVAKKDENVDKMWRKRQEVIEAYWDAGYIRSAWVILGDEAHKHRSRFLKKGTKCGLLKNATALRSVLLYKIGDLTVLEGNYNQALRIFKPTNPKTPQFNKFKYKMVGHSHSITEQDIYPLLMEKADEEIQHSSSKKYYWQQKFVDYIKEWTGIPCPEKLWKKIRKHRKKLKFFKKPHSEWV